MVSALFCKKESPESYHQSVVKEMEEAERIMFDNYSGLKLGKTVEIFNVPIELNGKSEYIHTTRSGDDQKEDLVMLHGFLVGLTEYYPMLAELSQHYRVWCLDLIGMGLSSRPEFTCQSTEETIDYFLDSIEQWRKKVGIERFHLLGHSFGGYMSTQYALRYPEKVKKLILLSPAGMTKRDPTYNKEDLLKNQGWLRRKLIKMSFKVWDNKMTPHEVAGKIGFLKTPLLKRYVGRAKLPKVQNKLAYTYLSGIFKLPESTLKSLHYILTYPAAAGCSPLEEVMHELQMPCEIYYGDKDWMSKEGALRVAAKGDLNGRIYTVPDAGHIMNFDNPKYVADLIIKHKLKEEKVSTDSFGPRIIESDITTVKQLAEIEVQA